MTKIKEMMNSETSKALIVEDIYHRFSNCIKDRQLLDDVKTLSLFFSCGKDCSVLLDLIIRFLNEHSLNIPLEVFSVFYPKHMYFDENGIEREVIGKIREYWKNRNVHIHFMLPNDEDINTTTSEACKQCKLVRKSILDPIVDAKSARSGILTGFSLFDALAYLDMFLLTCGYDFSRITKLDDELKQLTTKMLHKISLREHLPSGIFMIRPLLIFNDYEIESYLRVKEIPYLHIECKAYQSKFKRKYAKALNIQQSLPSYFDIESFLRRNGIEINNNGLSFEDVASDHYYIDC